MSAVISEFVFQCQHVKALILLLLLQYRLKSQIKRRTRYVSALRVVGGTLQAVVNQAGVAMCFYTNFA